MRAIAVTKLSDRRTKVVCGNKTFYVALTVAPDPGDYSTLPTPGSFIVDDGEDRKTVRAMSAEDAVEKHLDPPPTAYAPPAYARPTSSAFLPFGTAAPPPQYQNHARGNRTFITAAIPGGVYDVAETSATPLGSPYQWTRIAAASALDAVDEYIRRNP